MQYQSVLVIFVLNCAWAIGEIHGPRRLPMLECDAFGDHVFHNEVTGECTLKIQDKIRVSSQFVENGTLACPSNTTFAASGSSKGDMKGRCICPPDLVPSPDLRSCIIGQLNEEPCNNVTNIVCSVYAGLECKRRKCKCKYEGAQWSSAESLCYSDEDCSDRSYRSYYDKDIGKCILPLNGDAFCTDLDGDYNFDSPFQMMHLGKHKPDCPQNSHCLYGSFPSGSGPICKCKPGFGPEGTANRKCIAVKIYQDSCTLVKNETGKDQDPCDVANGLECSNGHCACANKRKWEARSGGCRAAIGSTCSDYASAPDHAKCGWNADCKRRSVPTTDYNYGYNQATRCECVNGFVEFEGFCFANHGGKCIRSSDCFEGMSCIDGKCRCASPLSQIVSANKRSCVNLAGSTCSVRSQLTAFAACINGTTTCPSDLFTSTGGECLLSYGKKCATETGRCNFQQGLACVEGLCNCVDVNLTYMEGIGCTAAVGSICGEVFPVANCGTSRCENDKYDVKCQHPASCIPITKFISKCLQFDK